MRMYGFYLCRHIVEVLKYVCSFLFFFLVQTGGDGCICYLQYDKDHENLEFMGMKQVKELSLIQTVSADNNSVDDLASCNYAAGFASADFIIWNLITEAKVNIPISSSYWIRRWGKYFHCSIGSPFWCLKVHIGTGFANFMWWMAASSFLSSWWCTRDKELLCLCQGNLISNILLIANSTCWRMITLLCMTYWGVVTVVWLAYDYSHNYVIRMVWMHLYSALIGPKYRHVIGVLIGVQHCKSWAMIPLWF